MNKQYLIMVEDGQKALLQALLGGNIQFLEVAGMDVTGNATCKVLVTPIALPESAPSTIEAVSGPAIETPVV